MTALARATIRRLRAGVVPEWEIDRLSVSYDRTRRCLAQRLDDLIASGTCSPLFVRGEWGAGKSHMLAYLLAEAARKQIACAKVSLNARTAALNYPQRFYPAIAESVRLWSIRGMRNIVERAIAQEPTRHLLQRFAHSNGAGVLGPPLRALLARFVLSHGCDFDDELAWNILLGADLAWADTKRVKALERIGTLARLLRAIGGHGLVAVLDEAETIDQLWNRLSRMGAYQTLGSFCSQDNAFFVFGITKRFEQRIALDLQQGLLSYGPTKEAARFLEAWRVGQYAIEEPPHFDLRSARRLAELILETYSVAYANAVGRPETIQTAIASWHANPSRNPRRLVRALIDSLDENRLLVPSASATT